MRVCFFFSFVFFSSSCAFVQVTPPLPVMSKVPEPSAPLAEREAFFAAHRSLDVVGTPSAEHTYLGAGARFPMIVTASGQQISDAHELLPLVGEQSQTAQAVRRADDNAVAANTLWLTSFSGILAGLGLVMASPFVALEGNNLNQTTFVATYAAGALLAGGALGLLSLADNFAEDAEAERVAAMVLYDNDLRTKLGLPVSPQNAAPAPLE